MKNQFINFQIIDSKKALVELEGPVFRELETNREKWSYEDFLQAFMLTCIYFS